MQASSDQLQGLDRLGVSGLRGAETFCSAQQGRVSAMDCPDVVCKGPRAQGLKASRAQGLKGCEGCQVK